MHHPPHDVAVAALLYARHGDSSFSRHDVAEAIARLPGGDSSHVDAFLRSALVAASDAFRLSTAAIRAIGFESDLALTAEEEAQLLAAIQKSARGGAIARADVESVTRRFLEEVLAGADVPNELLEQIVQTYVDRGALHMSEDGGRYIVSLR